MKFEFTVATLGGKTAPYLLKEIPCLAFSSAATVFGIPFINHNPGLELATSLTTAVGIEYLSHKAPHLLPKFMRPKDASAPEKTEAEKKALGLPLHAWGMALAFSLASWGIHQEVFHDHGHDHGHHHKHENEDHENNAVHHEKMRQSLSAPAHPDHR